MDDQIGFSEVFAWSGVAAAIGACTLAILIVIPIAIAEPAAFLSIFGIMAIGVIVAMFTALPIGVLIAYPMARLVGWSSAHAGAAGLISSTIILVLWHAANLDEIISDLYNLAFIATGPIAGYLAYHFGFGSFKYD